MQEERSRRNYEDYKAVESIEKYNNHNNKNNNQCRRNKTEETVGKDKKMRTKNPYTKCTM